MTTINNVFLLQSGLGNSTVESTIIHDIRNVVQSAIEDCTSRCPEYWPCPSKIILFFTVMAACTTIYIAGLSILTNIIGNRELHNFQRDLHATAPENRHDFMMAHFLKTGRFSEEVRAWAERNGKMTKGLRQWVFDQENKEILKRQSVMEEVLKKEGVEKMPLGETKLLDR